MKRAIFFIAFLTMILILGSCSKEEMNTTDSFTISDQTISKATIAKLPNYSYSELERLTKKMQRFHNFKVAIEQGYDTDLTGFIPQMGHHFANMGLIDGVFELEKPETLLYVPDENGKMKFVAVEYLVPMALLDDPTIPPEGFTGDEDQWAVVGDLWTLHAWVGLENPDGVFAPFNPLVD